ncbi:tetratricopeptide repeat protein [Trinickia caryophylli]|uniref:Tetratricopeptide repeat-containing protein n=1 Tax=Trinickia caryophylli TaxID=28094 RepID=A0A1X7DHD3_TRICW|nr:tetratricopeptide repeat protein [Trinickia caryophylli]WQE12303.1 tetratricopeptide repeat protein [Trinickia caryophylli]GLU31551.1 hypothetical protein Busp01_13930 [Trinickia caryophylli]SMF15299.1 Tetratricopeptide repeat-containing protein [Trinickia caryophylli]
MKPSCGRIQRIAALAASTAIGLALAALPPATAHAQTARTSTDGTPQIDASIAARNWNAALAELDARIASNPRDAQAKFKRGTVLARLGRDDEAIRQFVELTQLYPELPEPYNNLAALYAKAGRYEEARAALETAVKANPGYGLAYDNLGDLYLRLAAEAYKRAQKLGTSNPTSARRAAAIDKLVAAGNLPPARRAAAPARMRPSVPMPDEPALGTGSGVPLMSTPYVAPSN